MLEKITVFLVLSVAQTAKAALQSFLYGSLSLAAAALPRASRYAVAL
jgi:hypothetical protein